MSDESELLEHLAAAGIVEPARRRLAAYGALLLDANRRVNLTGAKDATALLPHLLDSLALAPDVADSLVDIGSGGGLPGIPLAIATGARVLLIEVVAKKAAFLTRALAELGVSGEAVGERAEIVARDPRYREQFAVATARAVARASTVAELAVPFLRLGGRALLQRGLVEAAELAAVDDAAPILGARLSEVRRQGEGKTLLVLSKEAPIGERFPRRNGVPEKRPLCVGGEH